MKFIEAIEIARKTGKTIKDSKGYSAHWAESRLQWSHGSCVTVTACNLDDDWQVVEPEPPKQYTFAEAYEMMKAGKAMRPVKNYVPQRFTKGKLEWRDGDKWNESFFFGVDEIESKWEEVNS